MGNNNPSRRTEDWKLGADAPAACERCDATANVEYSEELGTTLCANCFRQSADERNAKHVAAIALSLPERTDLGNAEFFAQLYANRLRHVRERGKWLCWRDSRWQTDTSGEAERAAKATTKELLRRGAELEGERQEKVVKWGLASQSDAASRDAQSGRDRAGNRPQRRRTRCGPVLARGWKRTGELREANPADLISLGTGVSFDPEAGCPRWQRFLRRSSVTMRS